MCEFCHKHGEGKTWYLKAENYSDELISDLRRRGFSRDFFENLPSRYPGMLRQVDQLSKAPAFVQRAIRRYVLRKQKANHFGQVVPIEEIEKIFGFVTSIVRLACICRHITLGHEHRYCYGVSLAPNGGEWVKLLRKIDADYLIGPDTKGLEPLTAGEALAAFREHEKQGLCHTVWTFKAPFIGGICNCDSADCLALKFQLKSGIATLFRAEHIAGIDPDLCTGCRECLRLCSFGALNFSPARGKVSVDAGRCFGCGICRSACARKAIALADRTSVPAARELWI
ncbi:MAG TPA: 4Fe-4S dicluster domain-containing protein [Acidobacteriota bacterium]|nr:4Fe-4S dicluster domain-containing protein [Acidobacteriota bacterium]